MPWIQINLRTLHVTDGILFLLAPQQWQYACRKTLADSRPRVRGRFAKNDDYGEPSRALQNHDEYDQIVSDPSKSHETTRTR